MQSVIAHVRPTLHRPAQDTNTNTGQHSRISERQLRADKITSVPTFALRHVPCMRGQNEAGSACCMGHRTWSSAHAGLSVVCLCVCVCACMPHLGPLQGSRARRWLGQFFRTLNSPCGRVHSVRTGLRMELLGSALPPASTYVGRTLYTHSERIYQGARSAASLWCVAMGSVSCVLTLPLPWQTVQGQGQECALSLGCVQSSERAERESCTC